ncbi:uncharacterized protein F4812DRAFT_455855 [Daldinia caldariorum]|uniref:uncharacterized protein n=1 Tax=Daldinia caldariorum TaxID=326644 RepID=UPI002007545D|nr:uncharacterized protein F4812DRAFT_455855 [Daldinia caldariorum]KAI1471746.1 hypothetical protein F4812DRAFT_455855 [Daldinia caldariorum]
MKSCWILLLQISAIISACLALSLRVPREEGAAGEVGNDTSEVLAVSAGPAEQPDPSGHSRSHLDESQPPSQPEFAAPDPDNETALEIPVSHQGCTNRFLGDDNIIRGMQKMVDWSSRGNTVLARSYHMVRLGNVAVYLCNCKGHWRDAAPPNEMSEVYMRLLIHCGRGRSDWIFSKKWEKGYGVDSEAVIGHLQNLESLCPHNCWLIPRPPDKDN